MPPNPKPKQTECPQIKLAFLNQLNNHTFDDYSINAMIAAQK